MVDALSIKPRLAGSNAGPQDVPIRRLGVRAVKFFDLAGNPQMAELAADYIEAREAWVDSDAGARKIRAITNELMEGFPPVSIYPTAADLNPHISTDETSGGFRPAAL